MIGGGALGMIGIGIWSFKSMGGMSSAIFEATIGAARARGEEIEEGVEERVWYVVLDGQ